MHSNGSEWSVNVMDGGEAAVVERVAPMELGFGCRPVLQTWRASGAKKQTQDRGSFVKMS